MNARDRFVSAAIGIASAVDIDDRMSIDPSAPGDRGAAADHARADQLQDALRRYRSAKAELEGEVLS